MLYGSKDKQRVKSSLPYFMKEKLMSQGKLLGFALGLKDAVTLTTLLYNVGFS